MTIGLLAAGDRITVGTGGTVITTTLDGLVGIGTTDPTQELHLDGDFESRERFMIPLIIQEIREIY